MTHLNAPHHADALLPSDFVEFLARNLELPHDAAQRTLVELMRDYFQSEKARAARAAFEHRSSAAELGQSQISSVAGCFQKTSPDVT